VQPNTALTKLHAALRFRPSAIESIAKAILRNASEHLIPPEDTPHLVSALSRTEAIQKEIYETHLRIVLTTCSSFIGRGLELADLFQEACQGLMNALDHFDPEQEVTFRGYAAFWILQSITRAIANNGRLIRLPVYVLDRLRKLPRDTALLQPHDPQQEANLTQQVAQSEDPDLSSLFQLAKTQFVDVDDVSDAELTQAAAADWPVAQFAGEEENDHHQREEIIHQVLDTLDPKERDVLIRRFGLNGSQPQTLEEIGQTYAVTRERIRQIEVKALKALRHPSRSETLMKL
jgi:RNA polymerase primary sigma factor